MKLIINVLLIFVSVLNVSAEVGKTTVHILDNQIELRVEEILPSRAIPWMYYDQAIESIPAIYPESKIISKIKHETSKFNSALNYSLVSFVKSEKTKYVIVGGNFRIKDRAWSYSANVPIKGYDETMRLILAAISTRSF